MIRTLIISGENNHDWQRSTPFLKELLEKSGRFAVDVSTDINSALEDRAGLAQYQLIVDDYNGPDPSPQAKSNLENAVASGSLGLVIVHAANNCFDGWTAFEEMSGYIFREGTSAHGTFHEFEVEIEDTDHPITRGLDNFRTWDELYHGMVNRHGVDCRVLATAYSAPEEHGSGNREPMLVVNNFEKGRIFHQVLGHVWPEPPWDESYRGCSLIALEGQGFRATTLRGCEWAATGDVTE